jgi:hypothetical protein
VADTATKAVSATGVRQDSYRKYLVFSNFLELANSGQRRTAFLMKKCLNPFRASTPRKVRRRSKLTLRRPLYRKSDVRRCPLFAVSPKDQRIKTIAPRE